MEFPKRSRDRHKETERGERREKDRKRRPGERDKKRGRVRER